jgi:protein-L-isoaspartate O-methyltransferase
MRPSHLLPLLVLATTLWSAGVSSAQFPPERPPGANPAGTGKFYLGREIAAPSNTDEWPSPDRLARARAFLQELGVGPGQVVADAGAGHGYLTLLLSELVGPQGKVLAVEIDPRMLASLNRQVRDRGLANVEIIRGMEWDPRLPAGQLDFILVLHAYHEFSHPVEMTRALVDALKPGGRLVIVESRQEDLTQPFDRLHSMSREQLRAEMRPFPLRLLRESSPSLPNRHTFVLQKEDTRGPTEIRASYPPEDLAGEVSRLRQEVQSLQAEVARLRDQLGQRVTRTSASAPGRIELVNQWGAAVAIVVNGQRYVLAPGQTLPLEGQPAGDFTYEVAGIQAPVMRSLAPGETFRVIVHPR